MTTREIKISVGYYEKLNSWINESVSYDPINEFDTDIIYDIKKI